MRRLVIPWSNSKIKIIKEAVGSGIVWKTFQHFLQMANLCQRISN
jgi:hypothetical protein